MQRTPLGVNEKSVCSVENIKWSLLHSHHKESSQSKYKINNKNRFKMINYLTALFDTEGFIRGEIDGELGLLITKRYKNRPCLFTGNALTLNTIPQGVSYSKEDQLTKENKMKERVGRD